MMNERIENIKNQNPYEEYGLKISRDDILQETALRLEKDPKFPDQRGERANHLRAKIALREVLSEKTSDKFKLVNYDGKLNELLHRDAYEVLELFGK